MDDINKRFGGVIATVKEVNYKDEEPKKGIVVQGDMSTSANNNLAALGIDENFIRYEEGGVYHAELGDDFEDNIALRKAVSY